MKNTMTWIFTLLALSGLLLQVYKEIWGKEIKERTHEIKFYLKFFFQSLIVMVIVVFSLTWVGNKIAKQKWLPRIVKSQKEVFKAAQSIVENDGWREDQLQIKNTLDNPE